MEANLNAQVLERANSSLPWNKGRSVVSKVGTYKSWVRNRELVVMFQRGKLISVYDGNRWFYPVTVRRVGNSVVMRDAQEQESVVSDQELHTVMLKPDMHYEA